MTGMMENCSRMMSLSRDKQAARTTGRLAYDDAPVRGRSAVCPALTRTRPFGCLSRTAAAALLNHA